MIRTLQPGQRCEVRIASQDGDSTLAFRTEDLLLEAPNWTLDGSALILNGDGKLWRLDAATAELTEIPLDGIPDLNNDHVLAPDGESIFLSANDGHIYLAPLTGGTAQQITKEDGTFHFLHGVSPDGRELAYVSIEAGDFTKPGLLMTMAADGGAAAALDVGGHCDGPEYSPDGIWLYFNTEAFSEVPGHAQLARIPASGQGAPERLLASDTVDWFPHLSPNGRLATYLRFPGATQGHPADLPVAVVLVSTTDWTRPLHTWPLHGGQGTLNVNSWSPDSRRFAYVAYPFPDPRKGLTA